MQSHDVGGKQIFADSAELGLQTRTNMEELQQLRGDLSTDRRITLDEVCFLYLSGLPCFPEDNITSTVRISSPSMQLVGPVIQLTNRQNVT